MCHFLNNLHYFQKVTVLQYRGIFRMEANNSSYPTSPGSDLSSKYTKLASEYSKVRAQLGVLKKAVLDEQVNVLFSA